MIRVGNFVAILQAKARRPLYLRGVGSVCSKLSTYHGNLLDNQRAEIVRIIILSEAGTISCAFPAAHYTRLANSVLCSPLVPIASNSGYEHGRNSPSVDPVHQGNQRFRTPDGNETRRQLHDAEHVAPR